MIVMRGLYSKGKYVCVVCMVVQLCLVLCNPMDCSPSGSSDNGISQARILEQVAISYSKGSSQPRDQTCISVSPALACAFLITVPPGKP